MIDFLKIWLWTLAALVVVGAYLTEFIAWAIWAENKYL